MKDLKTILEVGRSTNSKKENYVSIVLNESNIQNILFALAYTYKWDDEADKWKRAEYESLYIDLYKNAVKTFGKEKLEELGFDDDIEKVKTRA